MATKTKRYKARTLSGAESRVRYLEKQLAEMARHLERADNELRYLRRERRTLAMMAADGPCFCNPLEVMAAKHLRDNILWVECNLNPDGTPRQ